MLGTLSFTASSRGYPTLLATAFLAHAIGSFVGTGFPEGSFGAGVVSLTLQFPRRLQQRLTFDRSRFPVEFLQQANSITAYHAQCSKYSGGARPGDTQQSK
jgi:hypothetical protein